MSENIFRVGLVEPAQRIIVAYDDMQWPDIIETAQEVGPHTSLGKTNSANVLLGDVHAVDQLAAAGQMTMLDHKFHDIPNTVKSSVLAATQAGGSLITVHASGGLKMLEAAVRGSEQGRRDIKDVFRRHSLSMIGHVLGVTILTSLDAVDCQSIFGIPEDDPNGIIKKVVQFADMALDSGLTGIVCSPLESRAIRSKRKFDDLLLVTPAITPEFALQAGDQKRSATAKDAMRDGVDLVVIGRAINQAARYGLTKAQASIAIGDEIKAGLAA